MNICVFCSAQNVSDEYARVAEDFGTLVGKGGHALVWGGSDRGLMKVIAAAVRAAGGRLIAVSMELVKHKIHASPDEAVVAKTLGERKAVLLERSDAVVALPGGIGTLDELTEAIALKRHRTHTKTIIALNVNGFYDGLKQQFETMNRAGFFADLDSDAVSGVDDLITFANTPVEAMQYIEVRRG